MQQRHERLPAGAQDCNQRGRRDQQHPLTRGSPLARDVTRRGPRQKIPAENQAGLAIPDDERAVGELIEERLAAALRARVGLDALGMELRVDRVGSDLAWVEVSPDPE
jgi:hypothetical protein